MIWWSGVWKVGATATTAEDRNVVRETEVIKIVVQMSSNRNAMGILIAVQSVRKRCICRRYWIRCFFLLQPVAQFSNEDASFLINRRIPIGIEGNNRIRKCGLNKQVAANSHDEKHYHLSSVTWTWVTSSIMDRIGNRKKLKDSNLFLSLRMDQTQTLSSSFYSPVLLTLLLFLCATYTTNK